MQISICLIVSSATFAAEPWEEYLLWAQRDTGAPDCPGNYTIFGQKALECLAIGFGGGTGQGNRSCLMTLAGTAAEENKCGDAFQMVLTTQCHNDPVQQELRAVGQQKICSWLKGER